MHFMKLAPAGDPLMAPKPKRKLLKIGELVKRTGVQKETIHFYINQGLLPRPLKTSRNMASLN